jgi:hypothetical protein
VFQLDQRWSLFHDIRNAVISFVAQNDALLRLLRLMVQQGQMAIEKMPGRLQF